MSEEKNKKMKFAVMFDAVIFDNETECKDVSSDTRPHQTSDSVPPDEIIVSEAPAVPEMPIMSPTMQSDADNGTECEDATSDTRPHQTSDSVPPDEIIVSEALAVPEMPVMPPTMQSDNTILNMLSQYGIIDNVENASKPMNEVLPMIPLGGAQINMPIVIDKQCLKKEISYEIEESEKLNLAVRIYRKLSNMYQFRAYQGELYKFNRITSVYEHFDDLHFDYLINEFFGSMIEKVNNLKLYFEVKEYMKKDYKLAIEETNLQPLKFWGFQNGFCDIYTGECIINDGRYFTRNVLQCNYVPMASCPMFEQFIKAISGNDSHLERLIWEVIGYLLSNDMNAKSFFVFVGKKDTGKSLLAHVISSIVGESATSYLSANDFAGKFSIAGLNDKKLNVCMDLPNRPIPANVIALIKALTGNDMMYSDVKYKSPIHFRPTTRLLYGSNALLHTEVYDSAFTDRMIVIPFRYSVAKERQDFNLERKLLQEKEGICIKAMLYYKQLVARQYIFTSVAIADDTDIDENKVLEYFANKCCDFTYSDTDKIFSTTLYNSYENFCHSLDVTPLKPADFSRKFNELYSDKVTKKKVRIEDESLNGFTGIRLKRKWSEKPIDFQ